jgi:26S proteasome regulatory subunit N7
MMARDFKKASKLFEESVATFTATEVMSYNSMIFYGIITCVLSLGRMDLKKKIVDCPEILAVINEIPYITNFLNGLYECNYKRFFTSLGLSMWYIFPIHYNNKKGSRLLL